MSGRQFAMVVTLGLLGLALALLWLPALSLALSLVEGRIAPSCFCPGRVAVL